MSDFRLIPFHRGDTSYTEVPWVGKFTLQASPSILGRGQNSQVMRLKFSAKGRSFTECSPGGTGGSGRSGAFCK